MISTGKTIWLENGQECTYLCAAGDGHVVEPCLDLEDGPAAGSPIIVRELFLSPPHYKFHDEITWGEAALLAMRQETRDAREEHKDVEALKAATLGSLAEVEALHRIQDFIDGKITHFLGTTWGAKLITFKDAMETKDEYNCRPNPLKLLCLFGDSKGNLSWKVSEYRDGSGSWTTWRPFLSYEDAKAALAEHAAEEFSGYLDGLRVSYMDDLIKECGKHGLPVPLDVSAQFESVRRKGIEDRIGKHESDLSELREQLLA